MITDKQLMKVSLAMAIIGIISLAAIAYYVEPPEAAINTISDSYLGKVISVKGVISDMSKSRDVQDRETLFFTLSDSTGSIKVVAFNSDIILEDGDVISVVGKVSFYQNKYEIITESVDKI